MGKGPQPQLALSAPYTLQQNPQPLMWPHLQAKLNLNPNNKLV